LPGRMIGSRERRTIRDSALRLLRQVVHAMNIVSFFRSVLPVVSAAAAMMALSACGDDDDAPKIPHQISSTDDSSCLGCHRDGVNGAPKTPHPGKAGCTGCHTR